MVNAKFSNAWESMYHLDKLPGIRLHKEDNHLMENEGLHPMLYTQSNQYSSNLLVAIHIVREPDFHYSAMAILNDGKIFTR